MYLHIGTDVLLREKDIVAIVGRKEKKDKSKVNRMFLQKKLEESKIVNISNNNEKSFILTRDDFVFISPISPQTLSKRSRKSEIQEG